jgi:putative adenylate-forming enzyme
MSPRESGILVWHLLRTRWALSFASRESLLRWQATRLAQFRRRVLVEVPFHARLATQDLSTAPVMTKERLLENFQASNRAGISLAQATRVATEAERSRDFSPTIGDVTVGLSSGTHGPRGVFLVSARERAMWAGIMLGRALSTPHFRQLLNPWRPPLRIAFFLRANSNLYETLKSSRIAFRFFDLFAGVDAHLAALNDGAPDVLVAPARVLAYLAAQQAAGVLRIVPTKVISVAEVLEPDDERRIAHAFAQPVHQLYQCTEGFLGYTCEKGVLHLNEEFVHVEPDWLDEARTRFSPIVTDFSRSTQPIVRYRLDDVLRVRATPCDCGRHSLALEAIDGRCDDILWFAGAHEDARRPVFPDIVRHALLVAAVPGDYRVVQDGGVLSLSCSDSSDAAHAAMQAALQGLAARLGLKVPTIVYVPWQDSPWSIKRRRIVCMKRDESAQGA